MDKYVTKISQEDHIKNLTFLSEHWKFEGVKITPRSEDEKAPLHKVKEKSTKDPYIRKSKTSTSLLRCDHQIVPFSARYKSQVQHHKYSYYKKLAQYYQKDFDNGFTLTGCPYISSISFSGLSPDGRSGEYLASGSTDGRLQVHSFRWFLATTIETNNYNNHNNAKHFENFEYNDKSSYTVMSDGEEDEKGEEKERENHCEKRKNEYEHLHLPHPMLSLNTGYKISRVKWNPSKEGEVMCSFSSNRNIFLYDLEHCTGDKPTTIFESSSGSGVFDFVHFPGSKVSQFIAGGRDGILRLWDSRTTGRPRKSFGTKSGSINSIQISPDGVLVYAADDQGTIHVWDTRNTQSVLREFHISSIRYGRPSKEVNPLLSIALDPNDPNRLAFLQRELSYTGILDLASREIVQDASFSNVRDLAHYGRTDISYSPSSFLCVATLNDYVNVVEFSNRKRQTKVPIGTPVISVEHHPSLDYIAVGMSNNGIAVAGVS